MPLIRSVVVADSLILLWSIVEGESELVDLVNSADRESVLGMKSKSRRIERLAWRAALRTVDSEVEVTYDDVGAPRLSNEKFIAVSHCEGLAVVIISSHICSVDAEKCDRDLGRLTRRFISPCENKLNRLDSRFFGVMVWCAKEAMYKYSGQRELDFLNDIEILAFDLDKSQILGRIKGGDVLEVLFLQEGDYIIAYIVERSIPLLK